MKVFLESMTNQKLKTIYVITKMQPWPRQLER